MARTAGHGQASDEAPEPSFYQVTFDRLVVPVALRSAGRRIGSETSIDESGGTRVRPDERSATTILTGDTGCCTRATLTRDYRIGHWVGFIGGRRQPLVTKATTA